MCTDFFATVLQRIEEMVLEMDPDDEGGLVKKRGVLRWDKRKKKFIKDFDGNPLDKRGESKVCAFVCKRESIRKREKERACARERERARPVG